jgi:hypothetical protein
MFFASLRIPLTLKWYYRLCLYFLPITAFLLQTQNILQAIRCQTSPEWSVIQYGEQSGYLAIDFAGEDKVLYWISKVLLFWQTDYGSCEALDMLPVEGHKIRRAGSLRLLWPFFGAILLSHFIETLVCALQSRQVVPENGLTIWEHSLAFAEAEAHFSRPIDAIVKSQNNTYNVADKARLMQSMNAPPEVLIIALISSLSHLTGNILAVFGLRKKLRLLNTGIWGLAYMAILTWGFLRPATPQENANLRILRFPSVTILGFIPHMVIAGCIIVCASIYGLALALTTLALPAPPNATIRQRFSAAYANLQANAHLTADSAIRLNWQEDFFTALLKVGLKVLTAASEAVFLNEGVHVQVHPRTWLEEKRLQEIEMSRALLKRTLETIPAELQDNAAFLDGLNRVELMSGYARESKPSSKKPVGLDAAMERDGPVGVFQSQSRGRLLMMMQFCKGTCWLVAGVFIKSLISCLHAVGLNQPAWLENFVQEHNVLPKARRTDSGPSRASTAQDPLGLGDEDDRRAWDSLNWEAQMRDRVAERLGPDRQHKVDEILDKKLYRSWLSGRLWNDIDPSANYVPDVDIDDDATSIITSAETDATDWSDTTESGKKTPTQQNLFTFSRESTVESHDLVFEPELLAQLLDPKSPEEQDQARITAAHLRSNHIMTRSQHRRLLEQSRARVLTTHKAHGHKGASDLLSPDEEERILEELLLERRSRKVESSDGIKAWDHGAEGMGSSGPQCVVCQSSPRSVLMWPCGCLSLCDDCRVQLATRNFSSCVCCRRNVVSYSRMYVP